ncbi:hypothetical protein G6F46_009299 [Rhizopus delemar]|nr:hypothetical protein G6F46_009299 [Rhizopus delemar]
MHTLPNEKKKIQVVPEAIVCHIDESPLFDAMNPSSADLLRQRIEEHYPNFEFISHGLDDIFCPPFSTDTKALRSFAGVENGDYEHWVQCASKETASDRKRSLQALFSSIKKTTAKEDLLWHIKMDMLLTVARREGCTYIFFGDSATRQAIKMISWTAKGRGYSLPLDISVDNELTFDVGIMRPMKDMLSKEIGLYNYFSGIHRLLLPPYNFGTMMPAKSSIDRLTEGFINRLEREFPSTVSTVCRTTLKLTPSKDMDYQRSCALCLMPYPTGIADWRKHITVTEVPRSKKEEKKNEGCGSGSCCSSSEEGCHDPKMDVNLSICYSCQVDLKDYQPETLQHLPSRVAERVVNQNRERRLLNEIKDFLIDDE